MSTVAPLLTGPPLSRYLLYPDIIMNSQIIDFYYLFTYVIWIFHLSVIKIYSTYPDITLLSQDIRIREVVLYFKGVKNVKI